MILICHLPERNHLLRRLTNELDRQKAKHNGLVNYKIHDAGRVLSTGAKRNQLIEQSDSEYFSFIDDDDFIAPNYVDEMIKAMESKPDVITFRGWIEEDRQNRKGFTIRLGSAYEERNKHYYRWPNHICAYKRSVVNMVKFPDIWVQEDFVWSQTIKARKLLKTEVHIDQELYFYEYDSRKPRNNHARIR